MKHARKDYDRIQDPHGKIPGEEPVFLIRGQDEVGWMAVEAWANLAEAAGAPDSIVMRAREHAGLMEKWAENWGKTPDLDRNS